MRGNLSINGKPISEVIVDIDYGRVAYTSDELKTPTLKEITGTIKVFEQRKFYVWKGDKQTQILHQVRKHPRPRLLMSSTLADDAAYVMAGVGIIAGVKAYDNITFLLLTLEWSDEFIDPEEQIKAKAV